MSDLKRYWLVALLAAAGSLAPAAWAQGGADAAALGQLYGTAPAPAALPAAPAPVPPYAAGDSAAAAANVAPERYNYFIWDPADRGDWYEWWYYKVVVPGTSDAFYFCYGVVNPWDAGQTSAVSRSHVSAGSFGDHENIERTFKVKDFAASASATDIRIGPNTATDRALKGSVTAPDGGVLAWDLALEHDWGVNLMGWAIYKDWLSNIFWYPAQAGARMSGTINYRGRTVTLDKAPAYQDRNWGRSFPKWWTWIVSNNFKNSPGTILASGGGQPRVYPGIGFIQTATIGLRYEGREYLFMPTTGDPVKVDVNFGKWEVRARNKRGERLEISAYAPREKFLLLKFMTPQGKMYNDYEALTGRVNVKLYKGAKLIADLESDEAGIEYGSFATFGAAAGGPDAFSFDQLFTGENHLQ